VKAEGESLKMRALEIRGQGAPKNNQLICIIKNLFEKIKEKFVNDPFYWNFTSSLFASIVWPLFSVTNFSIVDSLSFSLFESLPL